MFRFDKVNVLLVFNACVGGFIIVVAMVSAKNWKFFVVFVMFVGVFGYIVVIFFGIVFGKIVLVCM